MNLGKQELLAWINEVAQTEYRGVEALADGVAFAHVLDAFHPGSVNMSRLNFKTRSPDDCVRNMRIVEEALKKIKVSQVFDCQKIGKGRFHQNFIFLQWLRQYSARSQDEAFQTYQAFERRVVLLQRQGRSWEEMSLHLVPQQAFAQEDHHFGALQESSPSAEPSAEDIEQRVQEIEDYVYDLQQDLRLQIEANWKLLNQLDRSVEDRNDVYNLLSDIRSLCIDASNSPLAKHILSIVQDTPEDLRTPNTLV